MSFSTHGVLCQFVRGTVNPFWLAKSATQKISSLYDLLIFSSVLLGMAGMGMVYTSSFIQGIPCPPTALAIMFLVPFAVYNVNRKTDKEEDAINRQNRFTFTKRFENPLFFLALAAYGAAYILAVPFGIQALLVVSIPLICGILYSVRWVPPPLPFRRLKEIPLVKNLVVASAWASISSLLPVFLSHGLPGMKTGICFIFFFFPVFIGSIIPDIRDREGDMIAGVRTIPIILGEEHTRRLLTTLNLVIGVSVFLICSSVTSLIDTAIVTGGFVYVYGCIHLFGWSDQKNAICDFLIDGQYILFGIGIFTLSSLKIYP